MNLKRLGLKNFLILSCLLYLFLGHELPAWSEANKPFQVGMALPLSGMAADYGIAIKNCIELAQRDKPELFTNIKFIYEDAAYEPRLAVSALTKLVDMDQVNLTATWGVSFCKALAPVAESRKVPLVGLCIDPDTAANKHYVLRFMNVTDEFMQIMARHLRAQGIKKIGLLVAEHPYLEEMTEAIRRNLLEGQSVTVIDRVPSSLADLRTYITKIQKSDFDSLGVFLFAGQISTFYKQAKQLNFSKPTFGTNFFESLSEVKSSNGAMEGVIFSNLAIKDEFLNRYKSEFKNESQLTFGAPAYEFAMTVGELFNSKGASISAEEILRSFSQVSEREGIAAAPYGLVESARVGKYFKFPVTVKRVKGDSFEAIG